MGAPPCAWMWDSKSSGANQHEKRSLGPASVPQEAMALVPEVRAQRLRAGVAANQVVDTFFDRPPRWPALGGSRVFAPAKTRMVACCLAPIIFCHIAQDGPVSHR